ncbi:hypothetical protein OHA25_52600 [Nonomuraea sp. NBC_00507]|uniref:hypothetical protein n=1 Tax=Nonomuraea sp. NBC_00507 TaxID=2976002 RepID=UPI002E19B8CA
MNLRCLAREALSFYPQAWKERYGEEVGDLIAARPVRLRTVVDLLLGAADAWLHDRRRSGATSPVPLAVALVVGVGALWLLWNPGVRDPASLHGAWAEAATAGPIALDLQDAAMWLFVTAGVSGMLSGAPVLLASCRAIKCRGQAPLDRVRARNVTMMFAYLSTPVWLLCFVYYKQAVAHDGYPAGPFGDAMMGGFLVPIILALVVPLPLIAARSPALRVAVRTSARTLVVSAVCNALGWLFVAVLLVLGLPKASWMFVATVTVSALLSSGLAALVARSVLRRGRPRIGRLSPV